MNARKGSKLGLLVLGLSLVMCASSKAQPPVQGGGPTNNLGSKTVAFEMRNKPWEEVIRWLSKETMKPFYGNMPTGSFTYVGPMGLGDKKTIPQVIDILNGALRAQKYRIIQHNDALNIVAADENISRDMIDTVKESELANRGNTELVQMTVPLKVMNADEFAVQVKPFMTAFGDVRGLSANNSLYMKDEVKAIRQVLDLIKDSESTENRQGDTISHKCEHISALYAERILKDMLGDPAKNPMGGADGAAMFQQMQAAMMAAGGQPPQPGGMPMTFDFGRGRDGREGRGGRGGRGPGGAAAGGADAGIKAVVRAITSDEQTNTVFISGPADKLAQAREILKKIDVGSEPYPIGPPIMRTYSIADGNAEAVADVLKQNYKSSSVVKITATSAGTILVYAPPGVHFQIEKDINTAKAPGGPLKIQLPSSLDATRVVDTLMKIFNTSTDLSKPTGAPYLEADGTDNTILIKGTKEQQLEVKAIIEAMAPGALTPTGGGGTPNMISLTIEKGNAAALAEALQGTLQQLRQNPVKVYGSDGRVIEQPKPQSKDTNKETNKDIKPKQGGRNEEQDDPKAQTRLGDPQKKNDTKPGDSNAPINIMAVGDRLIITSNDPAALAMAQELVRLYTRSPKGDTGFEVIRLKNSKAMDAAKILDEAFNGPKQTGAIPGGAIPGFGGGRGGNFFAQFMAQQQTAQAQAKPRIKVVADVASNSLLVQASPLDMLEIRRLLARAIDSDDTDSNAVIKTQPRLALKYADATEVASTLQSVYREFMNVGATATFANVGPNGFTSATRGRANAVDANGNPRTVSLSMGVDARSNSIILECSDLLFKDVKKLVEELDNAAQDSTSTIKLIPVKDVDPLLVQQALDVIQGRRSSGSTGGMGSTGQGGGFGGQQGGGFQGGGRGGQGGFGGGGQQGGFGGGRGGAGGGFGGGGFGGGGQGGGFGGGRGGAGGGFGGGRGGAGGGGGGRGGRERSSGTAPDGGPRFFDHAVMDDHGSVGLYDPQQDPRYVDFEIVQALAVGRSPDLIAEELLAIASGEQQQTRPLPSITSGTSQDVKAPRQQITAEILDQLGMIVIRAATPQDAAAVEEIIKLIIAASKGSEINYKIIPLKYGDATSVTATLNQMFSRVAVPPVGQARILQGPATTNITIPGGNISSSQNTPAQNLVMLPLIRFNAIFVAAPESRMKDIESKIAVLDRPTAEVSRPQSFSLRNASARNVATLINSFYAARGEAQNSNQIRITEDDNTNSIMVQAAPADMDDIRAMIEHLDSTPTAAVNDLRIYNLKVALADELSNLLVTAITQGVISTGTTAPAAAGILGTGAGIGGGGFGGGGIGGGGIGGGGFAGAGGGLAGGARTGTAAGTGVINGAGGTATTRQTGLRFHIGNQSVMGLFLADIHITPDLRTNRLLISAPRDTMPMIWALIEQLDVAPTARAEIKVFPLKNVDAGALEIILENLFFGTNTNVYGTGPVANTGAGSGTTAGATAAPAGANTGGTGALTGSGVLGQSGPVPRTLLQVPGESPEGFPLVELHITSEPRTNSLIVAGGRNELTVIEAIIFKLEDTPAPDRQDQVVKLQNASAADVATALQNFQVNKLRVLNQTSQLNAYQEMQRDIIIIPEPFTNKLLISATPKYFGELLRLIDELDAKPLQVMIQVMIVEVDLSSTEEFGVEIGLQSPVLFQRGVYPNTASGFGNSTAISFTQAATATSVPSAIASGTLNPFASPGFNFNASPGLPALGNNPLASPGVVGSQGVTNLNVGRANSNGLSGFVFSAASDSFNLLVRALKTQGRVDILSRPQIMTLDNQTATINIGQQIPYVASTTISGNGLSQQDIERVIVGVNLTVTPRISPDGTVLMRVTPSVSSQAQQTVPLGNGLFGAIFNVQQVDTTVQAMDGETVAIGGLITKNEQRIENKIPVLGDMPFLGALFRYRTQNKAKTELLVIMTPHVVRSRAEADRLLGEEARRMDWVLSDVLRNHGTSGMAPVIPRVSGPGANGAGVGAPGADGANCPPPLGTGQGQGQGQGVDGPPPIPVPQGNEPIQHKLPAPGVMPLNQPMSGMPNQPQASLSAQSLQVASADPNVNSGNASSMQNGPDAGFNNTNPSAPQGYATQSQMPVAPAKEPRGWNLWKRN